MSLYELVAEWMKYAKADLDTAKHLEETMHPKPLEIICYHCQQAAEKALKAFLVANEIDPPRIHGLDQLCEMCKNIEQSFSEIEKHCGELTTYGIAPKYPHGTEIFETDATRALKYAKIIYEKAESNLKTYLC